MRLSLLKYITIYHTEPVGPSAVALGRRDAAETSDAIEPKRLRITLIQLYGTLSFLPDVFSVELRKALPP